MEVERGTDRSVDEATADEIGVVRPFPKLLFLRCGGLCVIGTRTVSCTVHIAFEQL